MPNAIGNFVIKTLLNSPLHPLLGGSFAVITVRGRKTGKLYATPVNVTRDGDVFTIISRRERTWWRNLRGGGAAHLHVAGQSYAVQAEVVEDPAGVAAGLGEYFQYHPGYARYFGVQLGTAGQVPQADLERLAGERVVIRLRPG
jgi:deazaflavin-dependent oxidoreductase (nitroreductase family)